MLQLAVMGNTAGQWLALIGRVADTAGPWHALTDCYGQHPQAFTQLPSLERLFLQENAISSMPTREEDAWWRNCQSKIGCYGEHRKGIVTL